MFLLEMRFSFQEGSSHTITQSYIIQGDFFNWPPPKNHKFKKKIEYTDWPPPKSSKCQPVSNCFLRKS